MIVHINRHYYALWLESTDAFTILMQPSHNDHALHVRLNTLYNMHTHTHTHGMISITLYLHAWVNNHCNYNKDTYSAGSLAHAHFIN